MHLINKFLLLYLFIFFQFIINSKISNENDILLLNGIYIINSLTNNNYLKVENNSLILSNQQLEFQIINIESNNYIILYRSLNKTVGIDINNKIILYNNIEVQDIKKILWNIYKIKNNQFLIQNKFILISVIILIIFYQ